MATFTGMLNTNEIFAALYNMIISQQVFADNIADTKATLVDMARVDGGLYGDTKLYYATDALKSTRWGNDAEATNLLAINRPAAPKCQAIELDEFRQISLTIDEYLTKRAWGTADAFASFNSIMLGWLRDTKRIYDATTYNAYVGTATTAIGGQTVTVDVTNATNGLTGEEKARVEAGVIGEAIANLMVNLEDVSRDYNDYGFLRSYNLDDLIFVWNSAIVSKIEKRDLPSTFHKDFIDKFAQYTLPARYFGTVNATETTGNGTTVRSLIEQDLKETSGSTVHHVFAGDLIPATCKAPANTSYTTNDKIACKVMHKRSIPYMSAFEVGTSFFNPKSLTENHYLTFGHNSLEYLKQYPLVTIKLA